VYHEDIDLGADQFRCQFWKSLASDGGMSCLDDDVRPFDVSEIAQSVPKGGQI